VDGCPKFGSNHRYAFLPSAAVAWRASGENFIKYIPVISNLKVRASYGLTRNSEIAAYQALAGLGSYPVIFNGARAIGDGISRLSNPDLHGKERNSSMPDLNSGYLITGY
jgi:hypothetical protein